MVARYSGGRYSEGRYSGSRYWGSIIGFLLYMLVTSLASFSRKINYSFIFQWKGIFLRIFPRILSLNCSGIPRKSQF